MARTRNSSLEPDRRTRNISQPPPETTAPRVPSSRTRTKSASPGPSVIARKTAFRRDQPTPVQVATTRASPPQLRQTRKVVKRTGRAGSRRASSVESEGRRSSAGSENGGVLIAEREDGRRALPLVPEDDEVSVFSASKYPSAQQPQKPQQQQQRDYTPSIFPITSNPPSRFSTPGFDTTGTQLEIEDMDIDLIFETFPDLDTHAQRLLDLLILRPPAEDLLRNLKLPGSKSSKRLRLYEQNFNASKSAYGTSQYLNSHIVEVALGNSMFNPLLHKANLAVLANFTHTAQETSDSTFQELKEIERSFPTQFGDVVHEGNFQAALDLRTQTLVLGMRSQEVATFDPDAFLRHFFMEQTEEEEEDGEDSLYMNRRIKPWPGMERIEGWEGMVLTRITRIRGTFNLARAGDEEIVDFEELVKIFPWDAFVERMAGYIKTRLGEIERDRKGVSIADLVAASRDVTNLSAEGAAEKSRDLGAAGDREKEIPESAQEQPARTQTPEADVEQQLPTPEEREDVEYPQLPTLQEEDELVPSRIENMESLKIAPFKQLKGRLAQEDREIAESSSIITNTAQIKELKRRKTESFLSRKPEVQSTPRLATSLNTQEAVGINMAQIRLLKSKKSQPPPEMPPQQAPQEGDGINMAQARFLKSKKSQLPLEKPQQQALQEEDGNNGHSFDDDDDEAQQAPPSSVPLWKAQYKKIESNKNKENDKALALILPPPSPQRGGTKRKRFLDRQDGATRVSQIDDDVAGHESPPKRRQLEKGKARALPTVDDKGEEEQGRVSNGSREPRPISKGKARAPPPVEDEEEEQGGVRVDFEDDDEEGGRDSEEEDEEDEDGSIYAHDDRDENEERRKKSRRNLDSVGTASTPLSVAPARASNSPIRRSSEQSNPGQRQIVRHRGSRPDTPASDDESSDSQALELRDGESRAARVKRLAKHNYTKEKVNFSRDLPPKRGRELWSDEQTDLLIAKIEEVGCQWAIIRDMREPLLKGRTNVQLKDKARNLKFEFLKARVPLPLNFKLVTISKRQVDILREMNINPYAD